jgi:hypothetical protein
LEKLALEILNSLLTQTTLSRIRHVCLLLLLATRYSRFDGTNVLGRIDVRRPTSALDVTLVRFRFGLAAAATAAAAAGLGDGVVAVALVFVVVVVVIQEVVFPDLLLLLHFGRTHSVDCDCQLLLLTVAVVVVDLRVMRMFKL